jgi:hypothetical protein
MSAAGHDDDDDDVDEVAVLEAIYGAELRRLNTSCEHAAQLLFLSLTVSVAARRCASRSD